jgi:hypothetical protein
MADFRVTSTPGYNTEKHGQHGAELNFTLRGKQGAIVAHIHTGISPLGSWPSRESYGPTCEGVNLSHANSMGIFAHSELNERTASDTESPMVEKCDWLEGRACVCDGQWYSQTDTMKAFACEGFDGVKRVLEGLYEHHYGEKA